jgi:small subunit ribosomal protein S27Ae
MAEKKKEKSGGSQIWKTYASGKSKNKSCPKCGKGVFMAQHKDRVTCGRCGYTEFLKK